ncbi:5'-methylthioadenosine/S-adenosylhomocysteine nucleosidase [uncultured Corynebacterium sp.]|uniref:5'-methylthioadenosine/S-adenosylhomocysteine nucleosidase n=1 Tax=uncultured Corynebacterium sp. TaxID=159447 RepID=UPI0025F64842|nr:5'-methylthioadenosine/S-adenosylhomocysteine nucleosidase [uncultured Corynebacterium sp.]
MSGDEPSVMSDVPRPGRTYSESHSSVALLIAAMPEEFEPLKARLDDAHSVHLPGIHDAVVGRHGGKTILLLLSGIGLVNAAHAATVGLCLGPSVVSDGTSNDGSANGAASQSAEPGEIGCVMSIGTAGVVPGRASIGDVVVSEKVVPGDFDLTAFGYERGQVPGLTAGYPGDRDLLAAADAMEAKALGFVSVDRFVGIPEAAAIREIFPDASVVDMESSGLAQTAVLHKTPFISVRSVTDVIGESETSVHLDEVDNSSVQAANAALDILGRV